MSIDLEELLGEFDQHVIEQLASMPDVDEAGDDLDVNELPIDQRKWIRLDEVVAVVADLKASTHLGTGKRAESTASIYEAAIYPLVSIFDKFGADDVAIHGDGGFGVFWGNRRLERAIATGITIKTFSELLLEPKLESKWPDAPHTGFKVGVAASRILVKRVGIERKERNEEVWAGKAVNYATKAAQSGDRRELVVPGSLWDVLETNDYIAYSCSCGDGPSETIWEDVLIKGVPDDDDDRFGRKLTSKWCTVHGHEFCSAILAGETTRDDVGRLHGAHTRKMGQTALQAKQRRDERRRASLRPLRRR